MTLEILVNDIDDNPLVIVSDDVTDARWAHTGQSLTDEEWGVFAESIIDAHNEDWLWRQDNLLDMARKYPNG